MKQLGAEDALEAFDALLSVPGLNLAQEEEALRRPYKRPCLNPSPVVPNPVDPDSVAFGLGIVVSDSVPMDMEKSEESGVVPMDRDESGPVSMDTEESGPVPMDTEESGAETEEAPDD